MIALHFVISWQLVARENIFYETVDFYSFTMGTLKICGWCTKVEYLL